MLHCKRQNTHHTQLPKTGSLGFIRGLSTVDPHRKCIVSNYPLTDSPDMRFSTGIHTIYVRFLDNAEAGRFSAMWFEATQA